jgi:hypothetical protein
MGFFAAGSECGHHGEREGKGEREEIHDGGWEDFVSRMACAGSGF